MFSRVKNYSGYSAIKSATDEMIENCKLDSWHISI
jgi:hypothetical protein